jgi:hypothetical protein
MKRNIVVAAVAAALIVVAAPAVAKQPGGGAGDECSPTGTWYGSNGLGQNYIFTVTRVGANRFTAVAQGLTDPSFCIEATAWRGEMARTGPDTYELRQILLCESPDFGLVLWGGLGELTFTDCNHFDASFTDIGAYVWGAGATPFVDPFDIPFIVPPDDPPLPGWYDRMPAP